jgi:hypothetical protein
MSYTCFTLPGHEWRAEAYLWLRGMIHTQGLAADDTFEIIIGRLLGYEDQDIKEFISINRS